MRRLLYIPIVHEGVDLGHAGAAVARNSAARAGAERWERHQEVVRRFWEEVEVHLRSFDPRRLALYQDGLPAEGETGRLVVEEAARRGSANYRLILKLLGEGARLVKTEDPELLLEEHARMVDVQRSGGREESERLLERRDAFIAETINSTLGEHEAGVLFIGAQHVVGPRLAGDIAVDTLKDPRRIQEYVVALVTTKGRMEDFEKLASYVVEPPSMTSGKTSLS